MKTKYFFALFNSRCSTFFKEEISQKFKGQRRAFSRPDFYSFVLDQDKKVAELIDINIDFALISGPSLFTCEDHNLNEQLKKIELDFDTSKIPVVKYLGDAKFEIFQNEQEVTNSKNIIFCYPDKNCWIVGLTKNNYLITQLIKDKKFWELSEEQPSRAYFKAKESFNYLNLKIGTKKHAVDFGSAPGGITSYLLEQGLHVTSVDPGEMSIARLNENFKHIKKPLQSLTIKDLPQAAFLWFIDINLNPNFILNYLPDLLKEKNYAPEVILWNCKLGKNTTLNDLNLWQKNLAKLGFKNVGVKSFFSHHGEILLWGNKNNNEIYSGQS